MTYMSVILENTKMNVCGNLTVLVNAFQTGEGRWSSPSGKFLKLLNSKSLAHMRVVLNLYTVETGGRDATEDIKKECSKNYAETLVTLSKS